MTVTRRTFVISAAAASVLPTLNAFATVDDATQAVDKILGGRSAQVGRVTLEIPPLVENGNLVTMKVSVQSPMTEADYVFFLVASRRARSDYHPHSFGRFATRQGNRTNG